MVRLHLQEFLLLACMIQHLSARNNVQQYSQVWAPIGDWGKLVHRTDSNYVPKVLSNSLDLQHERGAYIECKVSPLALLMSRSHDRVAHLRNSADPPLNDNLLFYL